VASQCGHTDSTYKALKRLYDILSYPNRFQILAFPCNDFGEQEPWDEKEIEEFVRGHFKAEFHLFPKVKILEKEGRNDFWKFIIGKIYFKIPKKQSL
jgi:glutathione peroxidase